MLAFSENKLPKSFFNEIERRIAPNIIILRSNVKNLNDCNEWVKEFGILTNTNWNTRTSKPENSARLMICSEIERIDTSTNLVTVRSNITNLEQCEKWIKEYGKTTNTHWNVRSSKPSGERLTCVKNYVCHHSSYKKVAAEANKRSFSKNFSCLASIGIKVKLNTVSSRKRDPFLKKGLLAVITIKDEHNHSLNTAESLKFLPAADCRNTFIEYFNCGMGIATACKHHEQVLQLCEEITKESMANSRINPPYRSVKYWYEEWFKQNLDYISDQGVIDKGLCAVITIKDNHNHSLNAAESLNCLPADVCKEKFIDYFNEGMGVAKACKHHQAQLKLRDDISEADMTNSRINPTNRSVHHWFNRWRLQKLNPKQNKIDDNSKIDCDIEGKNNGEGDKKAKQSRNEDIEEPEDVKAEQSRKEDTMQPRDGKAEESGNKDTILPEAEKAQQSRKEDILQSGDGIAEQLGHEDTIQPGDGKAKQSRKEDTDQPERAKAEQSVKEDSMQPRDGKTEESGNKDTILPESEKVQQSKEDILQSGDGIAEQLGQEDTIQPRDGKAKQSRNEVTDQPGSGKAEQSVDPNSSKVKYCSGKRKDIETCSKQIGRRQNTQHPSKRRNWITEHWTLSDKLKIGQKKNLQANSPSKEIFIKEEIEIGDLDQALNRQDILKTLCPPLATEGLHPPNKKPRHSQLLLPQQNEEFSASTSISTIKSEENCSDGGSTSFSTLSQQQNDQHESSTQFSTINPVQNNSNIPNNTCSTLRHCPNETEKTSTSFSRMNLRSNRKKAPISTSTLSPGQNGCEKASTGTSFSTSTCRHKQEEANILFSTINCQQSDRDISNSTSLSSLSLHQNETSSLCSVMNRNNGKTTLSFSNKNFQQDTSDTSNALFFTNQNKCDEASIFSATNPLQYELIESNSSYSKMSPHQNDRDDTSASFYDGHEDDVDVFFKQIAARVKKLSPELINQAKMASVKMLIELENKSYN